MLPGASHVRTGGEMKLLQAYRRWRGRQFGRKNALLLALKYTDL